MRLFWFGVLDLNGNLYILWKSLFTERRQIMDKKSGGSLFICLYCLSKLLNCWHQLDIYAGLQQAFHSRVLVCTAFKVKAWIFTQIASVLNMKQSLNGQFPIWVAFLPSSNIDPFFVPDVYSTVLIENGYIHFLTRCHAVDPRENPKTRYLFFVCCLLSFSCCLEENAMLVAVVVVIGPFSGFRCFESKRATLVGDLGKKLGIRMELLNVRAPNTFCAFWLKNPRSKIPCNSKSARKRPENYRLRAPEGAQ